MATQDGPLGATRAALNDVSTASLQLQVVTYACVANQVQDAFNIVNAGTTPVALSDVSIKFWVDDTSGQAVVPHVWTGGCISGVNGNASCVHQVTGVVPTATSFAACGPDAQHQANWEITIADTDQTVLPPGATWGNIQSAVNLANYANFTPGTSSWYSSCQPGSAYAPNSHYAVYYKGDLVFSDGFNAPSCRAPSGSQKLTGYYGTGNVANGTYPVTGSVPSTTNVALSIGLPVRDPAGLKTFTQQVADPTSPLYRHFLTQAQFADAYGATDADYQAVIAWAKGAGLTVYATYPNKLLVGVSGTAAQFEQALFTNLVYRKRDDGSTFITVDREPSLNLAVPILRISGLDGYRLPTPSTPQGTGNGGRYLAADIRNAYLGSASSCSSLDGTGEVVGLFQLGSYNDTDIAGYDALQNPPLNPANVSVAVVQQPPIAGSIGIDSEVALDIEMVQAMAPAAKVLVFEGSTGITGHGDDLLHAMATSDPPLTVASSSWQTGRSDNAQQALDEMAAQGVSFFQSSGDYGDIGDPQSNDDMDNQTLVGGTFLSTNAPGTDPYYQSEATWNGGNTNRGKDVTSGGIMNGKNLGGTDETGCRCWPEPFCCGSGVGIPGYQATVSMAINGGSTQYRNFPDVSLLAGDVEIFYDGKTRGSSGTSVATPLWAGFTALANQASRSAGVGPVGFVNPVLYDIGLTAGSSADLYAACFNDIKDGVSNYDGFGGGFMSVAGYDLTTGWGTPKCQLIRQLSSQTPLTPVTTLSEIELLFVTGGDDLRGNSGATADLHFPNGTAITIPLKESGAPSWDNGTVHDIHVAVPSSVLPPLTETNGLVSVGVTLHENYGGTDTPDNWDISGLYVRLFNPGSPEVCQLRLGPTNTLQDGSSGVVRLSQNPDGSGAGPVVSFAGGSGCQDHETIQFTVETGADDARSDSEVRAALFAAGASSPFQTIDLKPSGTLWDNHSTHTVTSNLTLPAGTKAIDHVVVSLVSHNALIETDDNWNLDGVKVRTFNGDPLGTCVADVSGAPYARLTGSDGSVTIAGGSGCVQSTAPIEFIITTGGDEARGDSEVQASLYAPGASKPFQTFELKPGGGSWDKYSLHDLILDVNYPAGTTTIDHIDVTLISHNGFIETDDNWDINGINVMTVDAGGDLEQSCLVNLSGQPFSRLTGSKGTVLLKPRSGCP